MANQGILQKSLEMAKSFLSKTIADTNISNLSWDANDIQGAINIDEIQDGYIFTSDGNIIGIIEILPINFFDRSEEEQEMMADSFGSAFKMLPDKGHFKVMSVTTNLVDYEYKVRNATQNENTPNIHERVNDYINVMRLFQKGGNSIVKRFFYIFEYSGDDNHVRTSVYKDIISQMDQQKRDIVRAFQQMGNPVIDFGSDAVSIANIFYQFYNPKSCSKEKFEDRIEKVTGSAEWFGQRASLRDCIVSRGLRFGKWDYAVMDGIYHTYLVLTEDSFPSQAVIGWPITFMNMLDDGDIDLYYKQDNSSWSEFITDRTDVISRAMANTYEYSDSDKGAAYWNKSQNAKMIKQMQTEGNDMYMTCIILTIRANTFAEMQSKKTSFLKNARKYGFHFDTCYLHTHEYLDMVTPLLSIEHNIFNAHKRIASNMSLSSFYMFTAYDMFDKNGYWLGTDSNGSLFGFDNYNTKLFTSPHISVFGKTGAGKTTFELMLASRMRMMGYLTYFVLPLKGHEYKDAIESLDGTYIPMYAPSVCINICEIRPQEILNMDNSAGNEERMALLKESDSLLSLKVEFLINWIRIQLDERDRLTTEEASDLNILITRVYNKKGITDNNLSIYKRDSKGMSTTEIVEMPIIGDIYNAIPENGTLQRVKRVIAPWVNGSHSHMNGQTNVDLNNKCIAFDVNEDRLGKYLPAYMLIAFDLEYALARRDVEERCVITLDETWKFLVDPECSKYIFKLLKTFRAFSTTLLCATQQVTDCMRNEDAKAMVSMPDIKIFLRTDKQELNLLKNEVLTLSERDIASLPNLNQGDAYFCYGTSKMAVHFWPTLKELYYYEPKATVKNQYLEAIRNGDLIKID